MVNMKNNFILCDDGETTKHDDTPMSFSVENLDRFKTVKVVHSNEEDVPVGSEVRISVNAGEKDDLGLVIRRTDIIYVL